MKEYDNKFINLENLIEKLTQNNEQMNTQLNKLADKTSLAELKGVQNYEYLEHLNSKMSDLDK